MKVSTLSNFRNHATSITSDAQPTLLTRRGRLTGVYFPWTESILPPDLKRELFRALTESIATVSNISDSDEPQIQQDFAAWRKKRREAGRGR